MPANAISKKVIKKCKFKILMQELIIDLVWPYEVITAGSDEELGSELDSDYGEDNEDFLDDYGT